MKKLSKKQQQQQQSKNKKQRQEQLHSSTKVHATELHAQEPKSLRGYESYYKQLSEEVETVERHVRDLKQTPGLEYLTEAEAQEQVDFMLRFSAWVFYQQLQEQRITTIADEADVVSRSVKVSTVQKPKGQRNKKVTESLSR